MVESKGMIWSALPGVNAGAVDQSIRSGSHRMRVCLRVTPRLMYSWPISKRVSTAGDSTRVQSQGGNDG